MRAGPRRIEALPSTFEKPAREGSPSGSGRRIPEVANQSTDAPGTSGTWGTMSGMNSRGAPIPDDRHHCDRVRIQMGLVFLLLMGLLGPSCQRASVSRESTAEIASTLFPAQFSSRLAWQHLEALVAIGPRVTGTTGVDRARDYIEGELRKLRLRVETHTGYIPIPPDGKRGLLVRNLIAVVPGASEELVVLAAPFDTQRVESDSFMGANEGASGAAVLLELARVLGENPLPHTTWLVFLDGEAAGETGLGIPSQGQLGSSALAVSLDEEDLNRRVLILTVLTRVGAADLRIARDLRSIRKYRDEFFHAGARLGHSEVFRADLPFESPVASHHSFLSRGLRRVVLLSGSVVSADADPDADPENGEGAIESDTLEDCSPESLGIVGTVTLEALRAITRQFVRIAGAMGQESGEPIEVPRGFSRAVDAEAAEAPPAVDSVPDPSGRQESPETTAPSMSSDESALADGGES